MAAKCTIGGSRWRLLGSLEEQKLHSSKLSIGPVSFLGREFEREILRERREGPSSVPNKLTKGSDLLVGIGGSLLHCSCPSQVQLANQNQLILSNRSN